ncbi:CDP-diacylglycerol--serine O-phosphatidyltransferase [Vibrio nigripulchritudo SO65]|uniref:CDP-diacylglycerol--serine O-phosphatidyltransferase n=1 Tax=Vibrio nigripulchritudo TaxID=28173 RepID=UPI0003B20DC1|nr:CDP-diacylglycerol--serine O-phosphatidyltransferase [Vibrio nigripulchritudo]CCN34159.1 CDP-diacylglycerol--serine O-phosphatidyltransferase [Vibrio nigripulchritudo AM115]CCN40965.1 CDP-diacylglycerol--serine O-phosphatidyltransferase [Vibrio nigripulchritudo FTn2]CCN63394.1 CDP-diacylglycerol--serine O-phosphatidyltransferase [Vibrio nigripulchritudo POn4]CCN76322.1 CDP-diacylglycerol--serine O-phosphatidyltransferase [Vibrio nigripulchritudo SO65]
MIATRNLIKTLPTIAQDPDSFDVLYSAKAFREHLLSAIEQATQRIYIVALYLEDDDAGREILTALYKAKQKNPELDAKICVDWHRAQRGLIGAEASEGNAALYKKFAEQFEETIPVYGVPVRGREVFGVLHLKGFIIDNSVIYSGASLNNIYLNFKDRYRFDRYHVLNNEYLANCMASYIENSMIQHPAVNNLACTQKPTTKDIKPAIRQLRSSLAQSQYEFSHQNVDSEHVAVTPLVGVGKRRNKLNQCINHLVAQAKDEVFICTPYFNFPKSLARQIKKAIKRGVKVTIVVGDKTANDFYIPPEEEFKTIAGLPYLYEMNLRRFAKVNEAHIASRKLNIRVWKHDSNSYHLKGIWVDKRYMLITGNNLNPRAWKLDLENAILIQDHFSHLTAKFDQEVENILEHTELICTYRQLDKIENYPSEVQKLIRKITRVSADKILKQIL